MATLISLPEGRLEEAMTSALFCLGIGRVTGEWRSAPWSFDWDGKGVPMTHGLPLLKER